MLRDQLSVRVVNHAGDRGLMLRVRKEKIWGRKRDNLDVDANTIHVLQTLRDVSHRRRHAKEPRAAISNDGLAGRTLAE